MSRNLSPQCKLCRRAGEKLFLKGDRCATPKCAIVRKPYPPGAHGAKRKRPQSEFGGQLAMKQKMKRIYSVMERQLKKYFQDVRNKPGITGDLLLQKLEMRLDNVVFRAGFAKSRVQARQLVKHNYFNVNGKKVNIPSCELKIGDVVSFRETKTEKTYFKELQEIMGERKSAEVSLAWLSVDPRKLTVEIKSKPSKDDIGIGIDAQAIVEFYSR